MSGFVRWLVVAAACNQITTIVTESLLFQPVRERISERSRYAGELVSCHLCFGTWVGFALALVTPPGVVRGVPGVSRLVEAFSISFGGRLFNEVAGLLKREVRHTEEETRALEQVANGDALEVPSA